MLILVKNQYLDIEDCKNCQWDVNIVTKLKADNIHTWQQYCRVQML